MKSKRIIALITAVIMSAAVMTSCGTKSKPESSNSAPNAPKGDVVRGGTLVAGKGPKWSTLDPTKSNARADDFNVTGQVYESLLGMDDSGNLIPSLAESWDVKDDKTIIFKLKKGVKFHDGTNFNAQAAKFVLDWYKSKECNPIFASEIVEISSVDVVDEYTIKISLSEPTATILSALSNYAGIMISPEAIKKYGKDLSRNAVGTGPFKVKEAIEGDHITLVRNENYHVMGVDGKPLPYLDEVVVKIIPDDNVKATNLQSGSIDIVDFLTTTSIEKLKTVKGKALYKTPSVDIFSMFPNTNFKPLDNVKVRQAIAYAINKEEMAKVLTRGLGSPSNYVAVKGQWFYSSSDPYKYDPAKAKALLAEAGYPNGFSIKLQSIAREPDNTIIQLVQSQLKEVGINITLEPMERLAWVDLYTKKLTGEIGLAKLTSPRVDAYVQINTNMGAKTNANYSQYKGEEFNKLLEASKKTYNVEERKKLLLQAQDVYLRDAATIFMYEMPRYDAYDEKVKDFKTNNEGSWILTRTWKSK